MLIVIFKKIVSIKNYINIYYCFFYKIEKNVLTTLWYINIYIKNKIVTISIKNIEKRFNNKNLVLYLIDFKFLLYFYSNEK